MNFVALCIANVAPSSSGRCSSGVANVESTATGTPDAHSTSSSATSSSGFDGDSSHSRSAPSHAASVAAVSRRVDRLQRDPPGRGPRRPAASASTRSPRTGATTRAPAGSVSTIAAAAAVPDANATHAPPSSAPIASSSASQLGEPSSRA